MNMTDRAETKDKQTKLPIRTKGINHPEENICGFEGTEACIKCENQICLQAPES